MDIDTKGMKTLISRILEVAYFDVLCAGPCSSSDNKKKLRNEALQFVRDEDCRYYCEILGIDYFRYKKQVDLKNLEYLEGLKSKQKRRNNTYARFGEKRH